MPLPQGTFCLDESPIELEFIEGGTQLFIRNTDEATCTTMKIEDIFQLTSIVSAELVNAAKDNPFNAAS